MSQTGANADEWVPVRPGTEGVLALGLAHVILAEQAAAGGRRRASGRGDRGVVRRSRPYYARPGRADHRRRGRSGSIGSRASSPSVVPSVAIVGGAPLAQTNGLFTALAVNALNALVGSVGSQGGMIFTPQIADRPSSLSTRSRAGTERAAAGEP